MIGIVILNYCSMADVKKCVESVQQVKNINYSIYIVDNDSPDKSGRKLYDFYKGVDNLKVILHNSNKGFASGNNIGIKHALEDDCDFIVISNPDIIFNNSSIQNMINALSEDDLVGLVSPKILNYDKTIYRFGQTRKRAGIKELYFLKFPIRKLNLGNVVGEMFFSNKELQKDQRIYSFSGCCFCITKSTARELYPLDEGTFMYYEEQIIGWHLQDKGIHAVSYTHLTLPTIA